MSVGQLLTDIPRGDGKALETLVRAQGARLRTIACRITGEESAAEDVVQNVFLGLVEGRCNLRRRGSAAAWLARVTIHNAIDTIRRAPTRLRSDERHPLRFRVMAGCPADGCWRPSI